MEFESGDGEPDSLEKIFPNEYSGIFEYSVYGWLRFNTNFK